MEEDEKDQNGGLVKNTANQVKDKAVKEGAKKARQKLTKEATKKVASGAAKKSMIAAMGPVLFWVRSGNFCNNCCNRYSHIFNDYAWYGYVKIKRIR